MKKLLLIFAALAAFTFSANAEDFSVANSDGDTIYYNVTDASAFTVEVTYRGLFNDSYSYEYSGDVNIPSTVTYDGATYSVTSIGESAFFSCSRLSSITIPEGVTSIGSYAFESCYDLSSITIPEGVTSIGKSAFESCYGLSSITIPEGVTSIGSGAFVWCNRLSSITIPESVTSIGKFAFRYCSSLSTLNFNAKHCADFVYDEDGIGYIFDVFGGCKLSTVTIGDSVEYIPADFLFNCNRLSSITIPEGVTEIGYGAFSGCASLSSITIPDGVTEIGIYMFYGCASLSGITIPEGVTEIGNAAFYGCANLSGITIPDGVTEIGYKAFYGCSNLSSITIPEGVTWIGNSAFYGTAWLNNQSDGVIYIGSFLYCYKGEMPANTTITVKDGTTAIVGDAFSDCASLSSIIIPAGVTWIGAEVFKDCSGLSSITIPESVTWIGINAFSNCTNLSSLHILNGDLDMSSNSLYAFNSINLDSLTIPASAISYSDEGALSHSTTTLEYLHINGGEMSDGAFSFITRQKNTLKTINMGECTNTTLASEAFNDMYLMDSLVLPANLEVIGRKAIANCYALKSIEIGALITEIADNAFEDCRMLNTVTFAEDGVLSSIGNWAFYNCHELQSISIPEGVTEIGAAAFFDCAYLEDITLPSTVQTVGNNAFAFCTKLTQLTVEAVTPPSIEAKTFEDVDRSIPVYVPNLSVADYQAHEYWKEFNIQGISETATETVKADEIDFIQNGNTISFAEEQQVSVYNINGVCVFSGITRDVQLTTRGIYVVVTTSGATKVII